MEERKNEEEAKKIPLSVDSTLILAAGFCSGAVVISTIIYFCVR